MERIARKREKEKRIVKEMIALHCHKKHHSDKSFLCEKCQQLCDYAWKRVDCCPFMENKTFCSNCKVHCYEPSMREEIRTVMRYSGPRMIFYHPFMAVHHVISSRLEKRKLEKT